MAVSNLINGVDWYSVTNFTFLSTTRLPAGTAFYPMSALTYLEDGASVVLGGADGSAYILDRDKGTKRLEHRGGNLPLRGDCADKDPRRLQYNTIGGVSSPQPPPYLSLISAPWQAFASIVGGQALIATGTGELDGRATVTIWTYVEEKGKHGISFGTIRRVVPAVCPYQTYISPISS
jgi:hypothetical protein